MYKKRIFGYVDDDRMKFVDDTKRKLVEMDYNRASKSRIIELALMELECNNDLNTIKRKLLSNDML